MKQKFLKVMLEPTQETFKVKDYQSIQKQGRNSQFDAIHNDMLIEHFTENVGSSLTNSESKVQDEIVPSLKWLRKLPLNCRQAVYLRLRNALKSLREESDVSSSNGRVSVDKKVSCPRLYQQSLEALFTVLVNDMSVVLNLTSLSKKGSWRQLAFLFIVVTW